ncbi:MAG TPA: M20/M25/M40 family metallo-hydrolase [Longimicrobiales bacterium]|nr:M20/M25/M40 family metallo-hydrolase [Longimicrobiales bacterium]
MPNRPTAVAAAFLASAGLYLPAVEAQTTSGESVRNAVETHRVDHETSVMAELRTLLELPNLAANATDIRRNADLLVTMLERRGVEARILEAGAGPPAVYGRLDVPGARRTVVLYAHFDGQPVDPDDWSTPPWQPTLRDGRLDDGAEIVQWSDAPPRLPDDWRIYARSASDDKSPIVAFLAALDALRSAGIAPSVNLRFFLEGEEEVGSPNLRSMLRTHRALLEADAWILGDGPVHPTGKMQVVYGVRGVTGLQLTVYGPRRPLHSGHYGNWAPNPAAMLAHLLASMRDDAGHATIAGLQERVRPLTSAELRAVAALPRADDQLRRDLAIGQAGDDEGGLAMSIFRPALNITGLAAGGVGEGTRNAVPTDATAAMDIRIVPDLDPAAVRSAVDAHIRAQGYHIVQEAPSDDVLRTHPRVARVQWDEGYAGIRTPLDLPVSRAIARAVDAVLDEPALQVPMLGGSLPLAIFDEVLGAPLVTVPIVNADNNQHAANENLRIGNFWDGVRVYAGLMALLGGAWEEVGGAADGRD